MFGRGNRSTGTGGATRVGRQTAGLLLLFLAAVDALGTIFILRQRHGLELNPLMAWLYQHGEAHFLLAKLLLSTVAVAWLLRRAEGRQLRLVLLIAFSIYVPVVGLHMAISLLGAPALVG
jgi:hypothetical protein